MKFRLLKMITRLPLIKTKTPPIYCNSALIFSPPFWKHLKGLQLWKLGVGWDVGTVLCYDEQEKTKPSDTEMRD